LRILCRVAESFYIGDMQAKLQERAVDRRVRRSRSPSFLPVSSTMTGTIACGYVEGGVRVGMVDRGWRNRLKQTHRMSVDFLPAPA
jgi:hypothetical protein